MSGYGKISPNYTKLITIDNTLVVSVAEFGLWLNLSAPAIALQTTLIEGLIRTVTEQIEKYTWVDIRQKEYEAYYDLCENTFFGFLSCSYGLALQRSPILDLANITSIEYLNNTDQWSVFDRGAMTIDGLYENTTEIQDNRDWATIYFREKVPFKDRCSAYKIRIKFSTGYDPGEAVEAKKIPEMLKTAIKQIVALHYTYRGDCTSECNINGFPVPCQTKGLLDLLSVRNSTLGFFYNPSKGSCFG